MKVVVAYDRAWWRDANLSGIAYADAGPVQMVVDASSRDAGGGLLACFITGRAVERYGRLELGARQAAVRETLSTMFGQRAGSWTAYAECDWTAEPYSRGGPVGLMGPGHAGPVRARAAAPRGPRALGRHRHRNRLERLHGRRDPGRRASGGRGAGPLTSAFPDRHLGVTSGTLDTCPRRQVVPQRRSLSPRRPNLSRWNARNRRSCQRAQWRRNERPRASEPMTAIRTTGSARPSARRVAVRHA